MYKAKEVLFDCHDFSLLKLRGKETLHLPSGDVVVMSSRALRHLRRRTAYTTSGSGYVGFIGITWKTIVYHSFRQLWLVLGVKLMEINSNLFSR